MEPESFAPPAKKWVLVGGGDIVQVRSRMPRLPSQLQQGRSTTVSRSGRIRRRDRIPPDGEFLPLSEARQPGGKVVQAWAIEGDWDPALIQSNTFEIEWPPRSGRRLTFPEIDRAAWFGIADARRKILKGQMVFVDRLLEGAMAVCRDNR
jgi:predicted NUDIX family NTP pyrophosphohydrolase